MRRLIYIIVALLFSVAPAFALNEVEVREQSWKNALDVKIAEYLDAVKTLSVEEKTEECDLMISASPSDSVRNYVAVRLYGYFISSRLMGDEAVAVHLTDRWFSTGKASFYNEADYMNACIFAEFNRQSLIGKRAPALLLENEKGEKVEALGLADSLYAARSDRYRLLLFHDSQCSNCKILLSVLVPLIEKRNYPVDLIAVSTGAAPVELSVNAPAVSVSSFCDPSVESDYQRKYGVLQIPGLFLIDREGVIIGRGMDAAAVDRMLSLRLNTNNLEYGGDESANVFDRIFASYDGSVPYNDVCSVADRFAKSALPENPELFRQLTGDYLYYLAGKGEGAFKEGTLYLIKQNIEAHPEVWTNPDDSVKIISMAEALKEILSRGMPGTETAAVRVPGVLRAGGKAHKRTMRLDKVNGYVFIYSGTCSRCERELAAMERDSSARVFLVEMDSLMERHPRKARRLLDSFDLTVLPYIFTVGENGTVINRYLSF